MFDGKAFGQEVVAAVKAHVDKSLAPVLARLDVIEAKMKEPAAVDEDDLEAVKSDVESLRKAIAAIPAPVEPVLPDIPAMVAEAVAALPAPEPGKSVTLDDVRPMVEEAAQKAIAALPVPEAKDVDMDAVGTKVASEVERVLAGWERPKSVTVEELAPMVAESVQKAVSALPAPKDGCGIKELLIDRDGALVATMDDGRMKNLGAVVGRNGTDVDMAAVERSIAEKVAAIPKPENGKDGFALEHFDVELHEDGRTLILSFTDQEQKFVAELGIPTMIYRGVFKEGQTYAKGDTVTWGGSLWHCDVDETTEKPDGPAKHWTLAAKRGRDGKDHTPKPDNGPPKVKI